ncbi:MAG: regulatory signaling modulator protein AmpE [Candidatus Competibacteraceae bacterium]|nr:regulatory signaling modulator protein AmpE [Candidatus Competibacteraceae bacterium]
MELLILIIALGLDRWVSPPWRRQPLAAFRWLARRVETWAYGPEQLDPWWRRAFGTLMVALLVLPLVALAWGLAAIPYLGIAAGLGLLYLALDGGELLKGARAVATALEEGDLERAREHTALLVERDSEELDMEQLSTAAVETVLERGVDALFGVVFWYLVAGPAGAVAYRLVDTLDVLWGHYTPRYRHFGWAAARLDDLFDWLPARLGALGYALAGQARETALRCWGRQADSWPGIKAGPVLAAGGAALGLQLGGAVRYEGRPVIRPTLGEGVLPRPGDVARAQRLLEHSLLLWLLGVAIIWLLG